MSEIMLMVMGKWTRQGMRDERVEEGQKGQLQATITRDRPLPYTINTKVWRFCLQLYCNTTP